jgi:Flp pilus assembly protein TadG
MILRCSSHRHVRHGAYAVEFAIVSQLLFLFIFAHIVGGMAVFDYIEAANLAREGARWASVHGSSWQQDVVNGNAPYMANPNQGPTTASDVYTNAIAPRAIGMDTTNANNGGRFNYSVTWGAGGQQQYYYDYTNNVYKPNTVTVQVSYAYNPLVQMLFPFLNNTVTSTSTVAMQY